MKTWLDSLRKRRETKAKINLLMQQLGEVGREYVRKKKLLDEMPNSSFKRIDVGLEVLALSKQMKSLIEEIKKLKGE